MLDEFRSIESLQRRNLESPQKHLWSFEASTFVDYKNDHFPLWKITCGNKKPDASTLVLVGGVHGLERIGSQLCIALLEKYFELSQWDPILQKQLEQLRIVFLPIINPVGVFEHTRSNGNGVDLMRNSPVVAVDKVPYLIGGHRKTKRLPWFQGLQSEVMQKESQFLVDAVMAEMKTSKSLISLDIHSGFGLKDQIWFPWAFTKKPFPRLDMMQIMTDFFEKIYPDHIYKIEPQSKVYCTHGDLWDHLLHDKIQSSSFLPLTLELGSWLWVKKNPMQIFNMQGLYNPIKQHRMKRIFRRHQLFVDFLTRFLIFMRTDEYKKTDFEAYYKKGLQTWYK
ncbi:MAG: DUF2817 domain-containing protein [Bdellovibrio sp.]|nr:DUF2817 domain-containing protein [Bdellovibrio sp.]